MKYHLDFETYSEADLPKVGAHRYARDPSCEVLCLAIARGDEAPRLWVPEEYAGVGFIDPLEQVEAQELLAELTTEPRPLIYAHNAPFEYIVWNAVMTRRGFPPLDPKQMRCTAAFARRACIPSSLAKCAEYLRLGAQKDSKGSTLIRKFCLPQKPDKTHPATWRRLPTDDPAAFREFCEYCVQDVRTEQAVGQALGQFDVGGISHAAFTYDTLVNDEGFPVDLDALRKADTIIDNEMERVRQAFTQLTGLNPTQVGAFLTWMREHGYQGEDLRSATMEEELEGWNPDTSGMDEVAKQALELRRLMSFAAVKKVKSMLNIAGPEDNRIRGTLFYHGASTGRWSSKLVQQQNMKRSTSESEAFFADLRRGVDTDTLELVHGPLVQNIADSIRHFIGDGDAPLNSVDYAAIEARIVCWLAGQEDALTEFRNGVDRYKVMASRIFNKPVGQVSKAERFLGKQSVLGCGYGMGASKFQGTCASYGEEISLDLAELAVRTFRKTHNKVVKFWYDLERACKSAIATPGSKFPVGKLVVFTCVTAGIRFLMVRLPSKRHLAYPDPMIVDEQITFHGQIPGKVSWGRINTYGGKLVENVTQAVAADCMTIGAVNAMKAGHKIVMLVHDEAVRTTRDSPHDLEHFVRCLTDMPPWAEGLPLTAEGETIPFYKK
jgi:DNA polymerase